MKRNLLLALMAIVFSTSASNAQPAGSVSNHSSVIRHIDVTNAIDLILVPDSAGQDLLKINTASPEKVSIIVTGSTLSLFTKMRWFSNQRIKVYVGVSDLRRVTAEGNARVITSGVLNSPVVDVYVGESATVYIKSNGKVNAHPIGDTELSVIQKKLHDYVALERDSYPHYK